jgi:hypothetical protein
MPAFVPGIELARDYWFDVVAPILDPYLPRAERAAALLAEGSDVLGFDTEQSTDHGWGPKVFVFADGLDRSARRELIDAVDRAIPDTFRGYATRYPRRDGAPVRHQVLLTSVAEEFDRRLGCDPRAPMRAIDWLRMPTQHLRGLTAGAVFEDGPGEVTAARQNLAWYPHAVWLFVLGCQWQRIAQEEAFAGRCAQVGDEVGSALVAARLVRDVMRLGFLIEREYAPYSKWLGTAFARLECGPELLPDMQAAFRAPDYPARERALTSVMQKIAQRFNSLGVVDPLDPTVRPFFNRPFFVLGSGRFADACYAAIDDADVARFPHGVGAIDQWVDNTDVLDSPNRVRRACDALYEAET